MRPVLRQPSSWTQRPRPGPSVLALAVLGAVACSADTQALEEAGPLDTGLTLTPGADANGLPDATPQADASRPIEDVGISVEDGGSPVEDAGTPLQGIGEACTAQDECASRASPYVDLYPNACMGLLEIWEGGYCVDYCVLPVDPFVLPRLARADCPSGSVCLPRNATAGQLPREDIGACVKACQSDADCRTSEGYFCRHHFLLPGGAVDFENGYCAPAHCQSRGCPTSLACQC